ncbi:MAG: methylenetetrahydrofolate reductase C-terminal domain-containing protein [Candidatus Omnitrophota bacterium]
MIISEQKPFSEILEYLKSYTRIFLIGCGECATVCNVGGEKEIAKIKQDLEASGKTVVGWAIPQSGCVAAKIKTELAKNIKALKDTEAVLVMSCGLGAQSLKDNDRLGLAVIAGCNTLCGALMDSQGNLLEKCSMCAECVLNETGGICPVTLCPKSLLNGPCGGMDKGKCEVDRERDCAWVLIYKEMEKKGRLNDFKKIKGPKDHAKSRKPHKILMAK